MKLNVKLITKLFLISVATLVAIFYFFAKGVVIEISPASASMNAEIELERGFGFKTGNRFIFFPGKKILKIESPGYYSELHEILIDSSSNTELIKLSKKPGKILFSFESGLNFRIFVDGEESVPISNFHLIEAGTRLIEIRNPLYLPFSEEIFVNGMDQEQAFNFKLIPNSGKLNVQSNPSGAAIHTGKKFLGNTPLQLNLPAGLNKLV